MHAPTSLCPSSSPGHPMPSSVHPLHCFQGHSTPIPPRYYWSHFKASEASTVLQKQGQYPALLNEFNSPALWGQECPRVPVMHQVREEAPGASKLAASPFSSKCMASPGVSFLGGHRTTHGMGFVQNSLRTPQRLTPYQGGDAQHSSYQAQAKGSRV